MNKILIFGDSLADGIDDLSENVTNTTHFGATIEQLNANFDFYLNENQYNIVVVIVGSNDLANGNDPKDVVQSLLELVQEAMNRKSNIIMCTLIHDQFNTILSDAYDIHPYENLFLCDFLNEDIDTRYLDDDGIHLNFIGKQAFTKEIFDLVSQII